jgi:hypothetical protein
MALPELYTLGRSRLEKATPDLNNDPRGLICIWEEPRPRASYVVGVDPTVGIIGWDRNRRSRDDHKTDNGAIEVIRVGNEQAGTPDVQVAEYAAPIDPEDLADVANLLGRMYAGNNEDGQALCIIEIYPGPGLITYRKMVNSLAYHNHFIWKHLDAAVVKLTNMRGWYSSPKSVRDLWIRGTRWITKGNILIKSPYLAEELGHCEPDQLKMTAKAAYGKHDDRARAILMAVWAAHDWDYQTELESTPVVNAGPAVNWQQSDISASDMFSSWEERWDQIVEGR